MKTRKSLVIKLTYEHHVFLRAACDRDCRSSGTVNLAGESTDCASEEKFNLKPAIDLRRFAAKARVARSPSWDLSGDEACEQVLMCACVVATCSNLVERLRRPRAAQVAQRSSSMRVLVRPTRLRRGHWAIIVFSGRDGLTDVIRRAKYARPLAFVARKIQDGFRTTDYRIDRYTNEIGLMR